MSDREPDGPYVYQPFAVNDHVRGATGRLFAVGGLSPDTTIAGLTKPEAEACCLALRGLTAPPRLTADDVAHGFERPADSPETRFRAFVRSITSGYYGHDKHLENIRNELEQLVASVLDRLEAAEKKLLILNAPTFNHVLERAESLECDLAAAESRAREAEQLREHEFTLRIHERDTLRAERDAAVMERDAVVAFLDEHAPLDDGESKPLLKRLEDEWHDFMMVADHCSQIYDHVTHGHVSKPLTLPSVVMSLADDEVTKLVDEGVKEETEELRGALAAARATVEAQSVDRPGAMRRDGDAFLYTDFDNNLWRVRPTNNQLVPLEIEIVEYREAAPSDPQE